MASRYEVRKMSEGPKPKIKYRKDGAYGVWDSIKDDWVINTEYLGKAKCTMVMNSLNTHWNKQNK